MIFGYRIFFFSFFFLFDDNPLVYKSALLQPLPPLLTFSFPLQPLFIVPFLLLEFLTDVLKFTCSFLCLLDRRLVFGRLIRRKLTQVFGELLKRQEKGNCSVNTGNAVKLELCLGADFSHVLRKFRNNCFWLADYCHHPPGTTAKCYPVTPRIQKCLVEKTNRNKKQPHTL